LRAADVDIFYDVALFSRAAGAFQKKFSELHRTRIEAQWAESGLVVPKLNLLKLAEKFGTWRQQNSN